MATIEEQQAAQQALNYMGPQPEEPLVEAPGSFGLTDDQMTSFIQSEAPILTPSEQRLVDEESKFFGKPMIKVAEQPIPDVDEKPKLPEDELTAGEVLKKPEVVTQKELASSVLERLGETQKKISLLNYQSGIEEANIEQGLTDRRAEIDSENAERMEDDIARVDEAYSQYEDANNDLGELKIDRDRWWNNRSTGQKIAAALSLMISGYQAGMQGRGLSPMVGMINKAIEQDIRAQVADFSIKEKSVAKKKTLLGHYQDKLGNNEKAVAALKMRAFEDAVSQVRLANAKQKGPLAKLQGEQALVQLEAELEMNKQKYAKATLKDRIMVQKEMREEDKYRKATLTNIKRGGVFLHANKREEAIRANEVSSSMNKATATITKLTGLMNKYTIADFLNPSSQIKEDMNAAVIALRATFRNMVIGPGTISEEERRVLYETVSKPDFASTLVTERGIKKYNALLNQYVSDSEIELKSLLPRYSSKQESMGMKKGAVKVGG